MKYYFLAGYLPELHIDDRKIKVGLTELKGEKYYMPPGDWKEIELILLGNDVFMVEKLLSGKTVAAEHSVYDAEFWKEQIKNPQEGPEFILNFLRELKAGDGNFGPRDADRLYGAYYDYISAESRSGFLRQYFGFDRNLRNVLAAIRARQKGFSPSDVVCGTEEDEWIETLSRSSAEDFGLGREYPWVESLLAADHPLRRQELIGQILWNLTDEIAGDDPFHFNSVLSYTLRVQMLEKRLALSEEEGMAKVRRLEGR
jgi:hypothetical protein